MVQLDLLTSFLGKYAKGHQMADANLGAAKERYDALANQSQETIDSIKRERLAPYVRKADEAMRLFTERYPDVKTERIEFQNTVDFYIWLGTERFMRGIADTNEAMMVVGGQNEFSYELTRTMPACYSKMNPTPEDLGFYKQWLAIATDVSEGTADWVVAAGEAVLLERYIQHTLYREQRQNEKSVLYKAAGDRKHGKRYSAYATAIDYVLGSDHSDKGKEFWRDLSQALLGKPLPQEKSRERLEQLRARFQD